VPGRRRAAIGAGAATGPAMSAEPSHLAHVIAVRPVIISIKFPTHRTLHLMPEDFPAPVCFLQGLSWSLEPDYVVGKLREQRAAHLRRRPQDRFIYLCNEPGELPIAEKAGLDAVLAPHNAFVDERRFPPLTGQPAEFDAVLNAAYHPWKRHALAAEIPRLALIGYFHDRPFEARDPYYRELHAMFPNARFCNESPDGGMRALNHVEINLILNRARVGLSLSEIEGGNVASMEYMLSGLPVVSTPSKGGRDYFFDPEYCAIVPPDPRAIREAADALAARGIPRDFIRARTIERAERERRRFVAFIQDLYDEAGVPLSFEREWTNVFHNRLFRRQPVHPFWRDLAAKVAGVRVGAGARDGGQS
jgi:hypothetical protein